MGLGIKRLEEAGKLVLITLGGTMVKWHKVSDYGLISACETYRIAKQIIPAGTVYSLWAGLNLVGRYPTASEAMEAAKKKPEDKIDSG